MTYDVHVPELAVEVTSSVAEVGSGHAPSVRVGRTASDVGRHIARCEVPHFNARAGP
jgi:hypothetical protein